MLGLPFGVFLSDLLKEKSKLHPCTGRTAHRGSRGIALLFLDHGTRRGWRVSVTPRPHFTPGKDPVPIVQEAGWAPGPVWTGAENFVPTGIRSPDLPARSQSLYRLSYRAHIGSFGKTNMCIISQNSSYIPQSPHLLDMLNLTLSDDEEILMTQIRRHKYRCTKQSLFHTCPVPLL
jgi:hypothetical protein